MITVIITACGPSATLENTLRCLAPSGYHSCEMLVADAKPNTWNETVCINHSARYYQRQMDGFAANVNFLLSHVKTEYALLLGNDVMLLANTLTCLFRAMTPNTITQPIVLDTTPTKRPPAKKGYTNMMSGNCTLIPVQFMRENDIKFNESLFSYGEDTQFGFDWISHGGKILQLDNCYAVHDHRGYYNTHPSAKKYYYLVRNSLYVASKYPQWRVMGTAIALGCLVMKPAHIKDTIAGVRDFLTGTYGPHIDHTYDSRP